MSDELERHKAALDVAFKALNMVATATDVSLTAVSTCAETALSRIADLFPPEFEEVEVVRWMCTKCDEVYDMGPVAHGWTKCGAELNKHGGACDNNEYVKLTGTAKRPVKRPVVREVKVYMTSVDWEDTVARCFMDHPDIHGEHGTLIFRTAE